MKVQLLTNVRGEKEWVKGEVLESPFHPDIQGLLTKPGIFLFFPEPVVKEIVQEEKKIETAEVKEVSSVDKEPVAEVVLKKEKLPLLKKPFLKKGKAGKK